MSSLTRLVEFPLRRQSFPMRETQIDPPAIHVSQYLKNGYHVGVHPLPAALTSVYKRNTYPKLCDRRATSVGKNRVGQARSGGMTP
jgi:hypothetical protein